MCLERYPLFLALQTTPGLEDYAEEMILRCLRSRLPTSSVALDSALLSGHVLLKFLTTDHPEESFVQALKLCSSGIVPCISAAYICAQEVVLDDELHKSLHQDWRAEDLRKNDENRRLEKRQPWGARSGPDDRPKGRAEHRRTSSDITPSESRFLEICQAMVEDSQSRLSKVLRRAHPQLSRYSFRATLSNPQHSVPFPYLSTSRIERALGEAVSSWLDSREVESIQDWETLCRISSENKDSAQCKKGRLWKVDLKHPELDVSLQLLTVRSSVHTRSIRLVDPPPPYPGHRPRPEFPETIRLLLAIRIPHVTPPPGRRGRTALSPVTARLLATVMPGLSPFVLTEENPLVILDPCSGTGSIPQAIASASKLGGQRILILCGDILASNVKETLAYPGDDYSTFEGVVWTAGAIPPAIRSGVVDGIVADLPWGHRECTPKVVAKLYPRFLKSFAKLVKVGGYAVLTSASAPLMRRCISSSSVWNLIGVGGEGAEGPREVRIGGMRATVFLLRRLDDVTTGEVAVAFNPSVPNQPIIS